MSDVVLKRHCKLQSFFYNYLVIIVVMIHKQPIQQESDMSKMTYKHSQLN